MNISEVPRPWEGNEKIYNQIKKEGSSVWGRLPVRVEETTKTNKVIKHNYEFTVNTETGDFYLDCSKRKIWCKTMTYAVAEPIILAAKTIYHLLLPVSIPLEIYKEIQKINKEEAEAQGKKVEDKGGRIVKAIGRNLLDIARTPAYGAVLVIIAIATTIIGPFAPRSFLYDVRATAAKLELALHRGEKNFWMVYHCLQPLKDMEKFKELTRKGVEYKLDIKVSYPENISPVEKLITQLAAQQIEFKREHRFLFNDFFRKLGEEAVYTSPYADESL